jgi:hypothetical protein
MATDRERSLGSAGTQSPRPAQRWQHNNARGEMSREACPTVPGGAPVRGGRVLPRLCQWPRVYRPVRDHRTVTGAREWVLSGRAEIKTLAVIIKRAASGNARLYPVPARERRVFSHSIRPSLGWGIRRLVPRFRCAKTPPGRARPHNP